MLKYHAKALNLVGITSKIAPNAHEQLALIEQRIGRPLPASLREWYSLEGACDLLKRFSNADPPIALADLGFKGFVAPDTLYFRHENQGVCSWAVLLGNSDDPPVIVDYDSDLQPCADSFSSHIYSCIWDWGRVLVNSTIQAQHDPISEHALNFLRHNFNSELITNGWPGHTQYRFYSPDQYILIWAGENQADWWLSANNDDAMFRLVQTIWTADNVGPSLWSNDKSGTSILQKFQP